MNIARTNVAAVVFNEDGDVLLCKRAAYKKIAPSKWHLPGGKVEDGETLVTAIQREIFEELELVVRSVTETGVAYSYQADDEMHQTIFVRVEADGTIALNHENESYEFVPLVKIADYIEPELVRANEEAIQKALGV